jgi:hypothetical protein
MTVLAVVLSIMFLLLALVHVYWAVGGRAAWDASVPEIHGRRAFTPSAWSLRRLAFLTFQFLRVCSHGLRLGYRSCCSCEPLGTFT